MSGEDWVHPRLGVAALRERDEMRDRPMDDPSLRSAPAGRLEQLARIVVHVSACEQPLDDCQKCLTVYDPSLRHGLMDVAIDDLRAELDFLDRADLPRQMPRS